MNLEIIKNIMTCRDIGVKEKMSFYRKKLSMLIYLSLKYLTCISFLRDH